MEQNVIISKYDKLIMSSMKAREKDKLNTYKLIKAKLLEFKTQKNSPELNETSEVQILNKMVKEIQGDIDIRKSANRLEAIPEFEAQISCINELLPKAATESDIETVVNDYIAKNGNYSQKEMGIVIKFVKSQFTNADGSIIAKIVKSHIL